MPMPRRATARMMPNVKTVPPKRGPSMRYHTSSIRKKAKPTAADAESTNHPGTADASHGGRKRPAHEERRQAEHDDRQDESRDESSRRSERRTAAESDVRAARDPEQRRCDGRRRGDERLELRIPEERRLRSIGSST